MERSTTPSTVALPEGPFPSAAEYVTALQTPADALIPDELRTATPRTGMFDLPAVTTGQNAAVFTLDQDRGSTIALRAFTSRPSRGPEVYTALAGMPLPECMTSVSWFDAALLVNDDPWPAVTMPWVPGLTLERWLDTYRHDTDRVHRLRQRLRAAVDELQVRGITHGDLQHGNIIISDDDRITLVDYDGVMLYQPVTWSALTSQPTEAGHPNYQHPDRIADGGTSRHTDTFSAVLLDLSLGAIANAPHLYRSDGNSLILTAEDLDDPNGRGSERFAQLIDAVGADDRPAGERLQRWCTRTHELPLTRAEFAEGDGLEELRARSSASPTPRAPVDSFHDTATTALSSDGGAGITTSTGGSTGSYRWVWVVWGLAVAAVVAFWLASELDWSTSSGSSSGAASQPSQGSGQSGSSGASAADRAPPRPSLEWRVGSCVRFDDNQGDLVPCTGSHDAVVVQQTISQQCLAYYWPEHGITSALWFDSPGSSRVWCVAPERNAPVMDYRIGACLRDTVDGLVPVPCWTWHDFRIDDRVDDPYWCPEYYLEDGWQYFCLGT